jgi:hypothetical protein
MGCLLLLAGSAEAQVIYRCKGADGIVAIQSGPCGPSQRDQGTRYYDTGRASPEAIARRQRVEAEMEGRRQREHQAASRVPWSPGNYASNDARAQQRAACEQAKVYRKSTLERVGLNRTFNLLRQLNESVQRACKGL